MAITNNYRQNILQPKVFAKNYYNEEEDEGGGEGEEEEEEKKKKMIDENNTKPFVLNSCTAHSATGHSDPRIQ